MHTEVIALHEAKMGVFKMAQSVAHLTQSRYYSPAFNAAVFDGPVRIYFAQAQEDLALRVYFRLQQALQDTYAVFRQSFKQHGQTIFLMLYPNLETFESSFNKDENSNVVGARLGADHVVAVRGPLGDEQYDDVFNRVKGILGDLGIFPEPIPSIS